MERQQATSLVKRYAQLLLDLFLITFRLWYALHSILNTKCKSEKKLNITTFLALKREF